MSRQTLQWFKLYSSNLDDEDFRGMTLEQRGVYVGLLCHANRQNPRGTFGIRNLRDLANQVADGNEEALQSTLDYLTTVWRNQEGQPHVVQNGDRRGFRTWADLQRPPSQEPEAVKARKEASIASRNRNRTDKEHLKDGHRTPLEGEGDKEGDKEGDVEEHAPTRTEGAPEFSPVGDSRAAELCRVLGVDETDQNLRLARKKIDKYPHIDPIEAALECRAYHAQKGTKVESWWGRLETWMKKIEKPPPWSVPATPVLPPLQIPDSAVPAWKRALVELRGMMAAADFRDVIAKVVASAPVDGAIVLEVPDDVTKRALERQDGRIREAFDITGSVGLSPMYVVASGMDSAVVV
jgi:hypothetical protein